MKYSFLVIAFGSVMLLTATVPCVLNSDLLRSWPLLGIAGLAVLLQIIGLGMFEANAIQFGMDQMLEASSYQLSTFIHWYFWALHVGSLIMFYGAIAFFGFLTTCKLRIAAAPPHNGTSREYFPPGIISYGATILASVELVCSVIAFCLFHLSAKHFYVQRVSFNPFKIIHKVVIYAVKHKRPVQRSAFTYWEDGIPSRIDLGKSKYGGPFTIEEVEDAKTFFRLALLLVTPIGFHFAGDGFALTYLLEKTRCPSLSLLTTLAANPLHLSTLVIVLGVPIGHQLKKIHWMRKCSLNMLKCIGIGLFCSILQQTMTLVIPHFYDTFDHFTLKTSHKLKFKSSTLLSCYMQQIQVDINGTCTVSTPHVKSPSDNLYLLLIVPEICNGLSYLLVYMKMLEFICAQAPYALKGLLIGLWYSTFFIRYSMVDTSSSFFDEQKQWYAYNGVAAAGCILSFVVFTIVSKWYKYRERDEVVNTQHMIEDIWDQNIQRRIVYSPDNSMYSSSRNSSTSLMLENRYSSYGSTSYNETLP